MLMDLRVNVDEFKVIDYLERQGYIVLRDRMEMIEHYTDEELVVELNRRGWRGVQ